MNAAGTWAQTRCPWIVLDLKLWPLSRESRTVLRLVLALAAGAVLVGPPLAGLARLPPLKAPVVQVPTIRVEISSFAPRSCGLQ